MIVEAGFCTLQFVDGVEGREYDVRLVTTPTSSILHRQMPIPAKRALYKAVVPMTVRDTVDGRDIEYRFDLPLFLPDDGDLPSYLEIAHEAIERIPDQLRSLAEALQKGLDEDKLE